MTEFVRRFRGLGIAIVVLALSAGAVFAGSVALPNGAAAPLTAEETPDAEEPSEAPDAEEPSDALDALDADAADAGADNHGTLVSEAAQMETPEGFASHGEFVSCVAKLNNGQWAGGAPAEPVVLADLSPETCAALADEAAAAKDAAKAERAATRDATKAERAAARAAAKAAREAAHGH